MRKKVLLMFFVLVLLFVFVACSNDSEKLFCAVDGCSSEGIISYEGVSGNTEYYCSLHYNEMIDILEEMLEQVESEETVYKYSEYIEREYLEAELLEWYEKYNIRYYKNGVIEFDDIDLPMPEMSIVDFPSHKIENDAYVYRFYDEETARVFVSAYLVYMMSDDYEVEDLGKGIYVVDEKYYMGFYKDNEAYCFAIMEP